MLVYEKKEEQNEDLQKLEEEIYADQNQNHKDSIEIETNGAQKTYALTNKYEEECMNQVIQEVQQKNLRIFYISNIFSNQYPHFIWNLIKKYDETCRLSNEERKSPARQSQDQSMEEEDDPQAARSCFRLLFSFVWIVYCTMAVRIDERSGSLQKNFFEWLYYRIDKVLFFYF